MKLVAKTKKTSMKKTILALCSGIIISVTAIAQPVSDRAVIPVAVTLNQILRLHVTNGGNIEFVFNTIQQYKSGIVNSTFYDTDFVVASSNDWELWFGAEDATLMGTDLDATPGPQNTMALNNVSFFVTASGNTPTGDLSAPILNGSNLNNNALVGVGGIANGLAQYSLGIGNSPMISAVGTGNGGDILDNVFQINWQCGISPSVGIGTDLTYAGAFPLAPTLLNQNLLPDRYVTNVLLDINNTP